jgi:F-type H+-transporting ATPase subunit b
LGHGKQRSRAALASLGAVLLAAPAHAAEGGIQIIPDPTLLALLVLAFALLIFPVNKLLVQPLLRVLDERRERIEGARERAGQVAQEAEAVLGRYQAALDQARRNAAAERQQQVQVARREEKATAGSAREAAEQQIERARTSIDAALDSARGALRRDAEALARDAAERILGRRLA